MLSPGPHAHAPYSLSQDAANPTGDHPYAVPELDFPIDEDEDPHFWGGEPRSGPESSDDDDYEDDSDAGSSENDEDDDDDDDEEDIILVGHR
jgi:hypothetical protein